MVSTKARPRWIPTMGMMAFLIALPACNGGAWNRNQADGSSNIAFKPTYPPPGGRAFYVSGYGGADYSPTRPRKRDLNCPVPPDAAPAAVATPPNATVTVSQGTWETE
jgi:hypothetical protein